MKNIILVKQYDSIRVAHLYEHLYLSAVVQVCKKNMLLNYIDYRWFGKTYHSGLIYIDIVLLTPKAEEIAAQISLIKINIDRASVHGAMAEIFAEMKKRIGGNEVLVTAALRKLDDKPWQSIEEFSLLEHARRGGQKIMWDIDAPARTKMFRCELSLKSEFILQNRGLLPLFYIISNTLLSNISDEFSEIYHSYTGENRSVYTKKSVKEIWKFRFYNDRTVNLGHALTICQTTIKSILLAGFNNKTESFLRNRKQTRSFVGPDDLKIYETCGVFVGDKGWERIATIENIEAILKHTTLALIIVKERKSFCIDKLMK